MIQLGSDPFCIIFVKIVQKGSDPNCIIYGKVLQICKLYFLNVSIFGNLIEKSKISARFVNNVSK